MGKISLSEGFSVIPEGTYVFKIVKVDYKEAYGKLEITMKTAKGQQHTERFSLLKPDGSSNEGALNAFSYFAKTALNDYGVEEIDPQDLVGHFMECDVEHDVVPSTKDPKRLSPLPAFRINVPLRASRSLPKSLLRLRQASQDTLTLMHSSDKPIVSGGSFRPRSFTILHL